MENNKFIVELTARLKGNTEDMLISRNARKAEQALKGQISNLESCLVDDEAKVEDAQESLKDALYPSTQIAQAHPYIVGIKNAKDNLERLKISLEETKASLEYFKQTLTENF